MLLSPLASDERLADWSDLCPWDLPLHAWVFSLLAKPSSCLFDIVLVHLKGLGTVLN